MRAHRGAVLRFARHLVRDEAAAEDVLQETFLTALKSLKDWRGEGSVRAWLLSITRSKALMARRRRVGEPELSEPLEAAELSALGAEAGWGEPADPEALSARLEERALLERALEALPAPEREVVVLRDVEGLSGEDVARSLGLSLAAMKSRLHRGRLKLVAAVKGGLR